jgi:PAS domain S-box-containing protein/putative nucleotidyltransferase with HDIG domain
MKILYVEDNPLDADLVRITLKKCGDEFELVWANGVEEGLKRLTDEATCSYDVVLTDMHLIDGSGLTVLSEIRKAGLPVAVIMLTGQGDEDTAIASLKSGATDYIVKKQNYLKELPDTLRNAFKTHKESSVVEHQGIRVLYGEHNITDIDLTKRFLKTHAPQIDLEVVSSADEMIQRISEVKGAEGFDALLIDYHLPGPGVIELIKKLRKMDVDSPIIVITGLGSEEAAVEILKLSKTDYVVKTSGYLMRLPVILENSHHLVMLQKEQEALRKSEARFRLMADNAVDVIFRIKITAPVAIEYISPAAETILNYSLEELYADPLILIRNSMGTTDPKAFLKWAVDINNPTINLPFNRKDGNRIWIELRCNLIKNDKGQPEYIEGIGRDITQRIQSDMQLREQMERINALHQIDKAITSSFDLRVTYQVLLDQLRQVLHVDAAAVLQFDSELIQYQYLTGLGFKTSESSLRAALRHSPLPSEAIAAKKTTQINLNSGQVFSPSLSEILASEKFVKYIATPMVIKGQIKGVLEVYHKSELEPGREWISFLEALAQQAAIALDNSQNFLELQKSQSVLLQAYDDTLMGWANFLDLRDKETEGHTVRVLERTMKAAQRLGVRDEDMEHLRRGVLLHDIGKVGVPDHILNKPGPLTDEEWVIMKKHPDYAFQMLSPIGFLKQALDVPYCHHEKWDGSGYPRGLKGKEIPFTARIFTVFDVYDAITSDRIYSKARTKESALAYLQENVGIIFDPDIIDVCIDVLKEK